MNIEISNSKEFSAKLNSNLYDYIIVSDKNITLFPEFAQEFESIIQEYNPDIIHCDFIINNKYREKVYGKTIIFSEMKSFPEYLKYAAIKSNVYKKYGGEIKNILRPPNNLLIWHIPKILLAVEE